METVGEVSSSVIVPTPVTSPWNGIHDAGEGYLEGLVGLIQRIALDANRDRL